MIYKNYKFRPLPYFHIQPLRWKDKFGTPRVETVPSITIEWLWFGWYYSPRSDDQYYEQKLWIEKYHETKESWPWIDYETKKSSWKNY